METRIFIIKSDKPTAASLKAGLGKAYKYYEALDRLVKDYTKDWVFTKSSGWMLKHHDKKKALFYLIPLDGKFKISLTFRNDEREIMRKDRSLGATTLDNIETAKKYIEGYAIQSCIATEKEATIFKKLIKKLISIRRGI